jgi:ribose/xylose/arabinose/galactoside ABC-type transport system permease subunit
LTAQLADETTFGSGSLDDDRRWAATGRRRRGIEALWRLIQLGSVLALAVLWVVMAFLSPYFFTVTNVSNMLQAAAIPAALALGQLLVILIGGIDLSQGATYVLAAVVGARFAHEVTGGGPATLVVMLGVGAVVGVVNGVLTEYVRLGSSFVVTLGTLSVVTGAVYVVSGGLTVSGVPALLTQLGGGYLGRVPVAAVVVAALAVVAYVGTSRIRWGRWIYAIGSNREGARKVGIPVPAVAASAFVLSGLLAGVAGVFEAGLTDSGSPTVTLTAELDAITAVVIGGAALTGGRGTVWGTLVGVLIIETIHNGLNLLNIPSNWEPVVLGAVLLCAVGMERARAYLETQLRLAEARLAGEV